MMLRSHNLDIEAYYQDDHSPMRSEKLRPSLVVWTLLELRCLSPDVRYFPFNTRGVYYTDDNQLFLNDNFMVRPNTSCLFFVMKGMPLRIAWQEASTTLIIHNEEDVLGCAVMLRDTYDENDSIHLRLFQAEAFWAGHTEDMTLDALGSLCLSHTDVGNL